MRRKRLLFKEITSVLISNTRTRYLNFTKPLVYNNRVFFSSIRLYFHYFIYKKLGLLDKLEEGHIICR
jgi:hypothetical protein